ncbi:MAG: lanthionine synthetase C family protein [Sciscionella sp.]
MSYTDPGAPPPEHDPSPRWGQSLSTGAAGLALLHITYAQTGAGDWVNAHRWIIAMTRNPVIAHPDACLFHGAPAVAFALRLADHPGYVAVLARIDSHIVTLTRHRLERAHERIDRAQMPQLREFDLINGLTGIGVYLLQAANTDLLRDVLAYLLRLTEPIATDGQRLPGWWTGNGPADRPEPQWPGGHVNLGLAHGIGGPLALLASAMIHGITVPGHGEAIDRLDAAVERWRCGTRLAPWWPATICPAEWKTGAIAAPGPQRPSWCYGTPGLARARQLAGSALGDPRRQRRAETALASCIADDTQLAQLRDDSLCHGWAGLVHTTRHAAADAGPGSHLGAQLPGLRARWEQHQQPSHPRLPDQDGMLQGAAGIALTRHTPDIGGLSTARWDTCLLLTPATSQNTPHR